jgi:hypothetical protein
MTNNYQKEKTFKEMTNEEKINLYRGMILVLLGLMLIFFFFGWCYVYNKDYGVEVNCNGWNFICMSFCWNFKSTSKVFGDMAVPFYYYAKYYVIVLEVMTTIIFYLTLVLIALVAFNLKKANRKITTIFMVLSIVYSVALLAAFITALTMNGSKILPKYCSNNPKCSVDSLIIFPFLLSVVIMIVNIVLRNKLAGKETEQ